jgi:hypothetical protein
MNSSYGFNFQKKLLQVGVVSSGALRLLGRARLDWQAAQLETA